MSTENLPEYIQQLLQTGIYPHEVEQVELIQTHISYVTLAGDFVYKWKKEVNFGFLDFSTLDLRKLNCERELTLNRRLCPELYLEVVAITCLDGNYAINGDGEVVEYGVKMRRMDQNGLMSRRIADGMLSENDLDTIVDVLVPFYESAEGYASIRDFGKASSVAVNVLENFEQTECFIDEHVLPRERFEKIKEYATAMLAQETLFAARINDGKIRDCHGDLYSANICFDKDETFIFDCIEFNERFRFSDVAADVAFLAMDLDFHGLSSLGEYFITRFTAKSGDTSLMTVLDFYKCYRAYVRGKIGLFTAADPAVPAEVANRCREDAARYFSLAESYVS